MDIAKWLNAIGLGLYETVFREHEIDADVLPDLTEADLEKIGVPLGSRRRLLRAIAKLASNVPPPPAPEPARSPLPIAPAPISNGARSRSCSAISSARRALRPSSTRKTGAISSRLSRRSLSGALSHSRRIGHFRWISRPRGGPQMINFPLARSLSAQRG